MQAMPQLSARSEERRVEEVGEEGEERCGETRTRPDQVCQVAPLYSARGRTEECEECFSRL